MLSEEAEAEKAAAETNDGIDDNTSLMTRSQLDARFINNLKKDSVDQFLQLEADQFSAKNHK